jgi:YggT family protein
MPRPIFELLLLVLDIYWWVVIVAVIVSWLVSFGVLNVHNPNARIVLRALYAITEPVFRQIRWVIPDLGGIDISPIITVIAIWFLERVVVWLADHYMV